MRERDSFIIFDVLEWLELEGEFGCYGCIRLVVMRLEGS